MIRFNIHNNSDLFTVDWFFACFFSYSECWWHHAGNLTNCYCVIKCTSFHWLEICLFCLQIKTRGGWRFNYNSSDGSTPTNSTAEHSAVNGRKADGSRWEEDEASNCQQQWAPSNAKYQRWISKSPSTFATSWRWKAQQGESSWHLTLLYNNWTSGAVCPRPIPLRILVEQLFRDNELFSQSCVDWV